MVQRSVLITGASSGIGAAAAREFAAQGDFVFLLGRHQGRLEALQKELPNSAFLICDLQNPGDVSRSVQSLLSHPAAKNLEVLINNAGIFKTHSTLTGSDELWTEQFQVNLMGPVRLTRALWPHFQAQRKGAIINISSTLGLKPTATTSAYSAIKAALLNWTQALALEGGPLGIRVNAVSPGFVDTPIHSFHHQEASEKSKTLEQLASLQPLGRIGTPEEIAKSIVFLASEDSKWTTGANLNVDGGIFLT